MYYVLVYFFFFKQKTAYEMRISDWSSDVCSSDLLHREIGQLIKHEPQRRTISHAENHGNREDGEHPYHRHRGQRWPRAIMTSNADQREADREQKDEEDADADGSRVDLLRQQKFEADIDDPHADRKSVV